MKYITTVDGKEYQVELLENDKVSVDGKVYTIDFATISGQPVLTLLANNQSHEARIFQEEDGWGVLLRGSLYRAQVVDEREKRLRAAAGATIIDSGVFTLKAPMPGLVVKVPVQPGDEVAPGEVLLILESMKMQNELKAPRAGTVTRVLVKEGESVEKNAQLVSVE